MLFCYHSYAQVEINSEQLIGTKWSIPSPTNIQDHLQFHSDNFIHTWDIEYDIDHGNGRYVKRKEDIEHKKRHGEKKYYYYLAKKEPSCFNHKKVGKKTKGTYLVCFNTFTQKMDYYKIISFSDTQMVLFQKLEELKEGEIRMGPAEDTQIVLERIVE